MSYQTVLNEICHEKIVGGDVYAFKTKDNYSLETKMIELPMAQNQGRRKYSIHISCMSGCPVQCRFCATGNMPAWRNLTTNEMLAQVEAMLSTSNATHSETDYLIGFMRMGEPFLNLKNVKNVISRLREIHPTFQYCITTIGIKGSDFSWIKDPIRLQISIHTLRDEVRKKLIPYKNVMSIDELRRVRTGDGKSVDVCITLADETEYDLSEAMKHFQEPFFSIKWTPMQPL